MHGRQPIARAMLVAVAFATAMNCSNGTGPIPLAGTYALIQDHGARLPARYDPLAPGPPYTMITGGTLQMYAADSMRLIIQLQRVDANGVAVGTLPDDDWWFPFTLVGDSLVVPTPYFVSGGAVVEPRIRLTAHFPTPPSEGFSLPHEFLFARR